MFEVNLASLTNFDTMNVVTGNLALDGVVHVTSLDGYNPVVGDTFTIITFDDGVADASDLAGMFASLTASGFDPSVQFGVQYFAHSVVLNVTASQVPAPAAFWLFGTGLAGALGWPRRSRLRKIAQAGASGCASGAAFRKASSSRQAASMRAITG